MKRSACFLILLLPLFALPAAAAEPVTNQPPQKRELPAQAPPTVRPAEEKTTAKPQNKPPAPKAESFTPSERIDADAVVAFPADI
jgi:hypothetical protein